ncbi:MAG: diacylglycerol kinase [Candidatus Binatia bacterium]
MLRRFLDVWKPLAYATRCSVAGLRAALRHHRAVRQEVLVLLLIIPAGLWFGDSGVERALLIGSWLLVLVVEIINSAIETVVDRVGLERNELSGRAKDLGSAAVFLAIVLAGFVWALVLIR